MEPLKINLSIERLRTVIRQDPKKSGVLAILATAFVVLIGRAVHPSMGGPSHASAAPASALALRDIIDRPESWHGFAAAARRRFEALFSEAAVTRATVSALHEHLGHARGGLHPALPLPALRGRSG